MDRATFFDAIRPHIKLDQPAVNGIEALLDKGQNLPLHHMANILAQVRRETGGIMAPIKETVMPHHKDRNPSDAEVIRRLDRAYATGKLPWVKAPYWRGGAFGRGQIQTTHDDNYRKFGAIPYSKALEPAMSAHIAVVGMMDGMFRGHKLSDYQFPAALDAKPDDNPRRIVNGKDGSDAEVAASHRMFAAALEQAGWGDVPKKPTYAPLPPAKENYTVLASIPAATSAPAAPPAIEVPPQPSFLNLFRSLLEFFTRKKGL